MNETTDIATMLAPVWRRKWLILAVAVVVAAVTYVYYHRQIHVYSANTQLDLSNGSEAQQLAGGPQAKTNLNTRALADAATLITSSSVTEAVRAHLASEHIHSKSIGKVRAKAAAESYIVTITAEAHSPKAAARLANYYALAYIARQHARYKSEVEAAIANTRRQLRRIEDGQAASLNAARQSSAGKGKGKSSSPSKATTLGGSAVIETASLASKINQLESELSISSVQQVNPAKPSSAQLVAPTPGKNAIFGFVLGLLAAGIAVFAVSRFDRRIGSLAQIETIFKARILTLLPREATPISAQDGQPRPAESLLEPLRRLHTAIHMGDMLEPAGATSPRLILFLSADSGDGKSTLVADLALTQRDAGARVAVIEADLRRPVQAGLLGVSDSLGLAEVLGGAAPFDRAVQSVGVASRAHVELSREGAGISTLVQAPATGSLSVLVSGGPVANPPALLAGEGMRELLSNATSDYDYVLVDAPPPQQVSDAMPLLHWVDGIVIVTRMGHTHQASAAQLARLLAVSSTAPVLGVVVNAVRNGEIKRSGLASTYGERPQSHGR